MRAAVTPLRLCLPTPGPAGRGPLRTEVFRLLPDLEEARIYQTAREFWVWSELPKDDVKLLLPSQEGELHEPGPLVRKRAVLVRPGVTQESEIAALFLRCHERD